VWQYGFARTGTADEQARAVARQTTSAQTVESLNAGGHLGQGLGSFALSSIHGVWWFP